MQSTDIPTNLPRGISAVIINGAIRYRVRTSKFGKRQSLGTFLTLDDAIQAITQYQYGRLQDYVAQKQKIEDQRLEADKEKYFFLLQDAPLFKLDPNKEYQTFNEEGEIVTIPAKFVKLYLESMNGDNNEAE